MRCVLSPNKARFAVRRRRCALVTLGSACLVGFGSFSVYLALAQRGFDELGYSEEIKTETREKGLEPGDGDGALGTTHSPRRYAWRRARARGNACLSRATLKRALFFSNESSRVSPPSPKVGPADAVDHRAGWVRATLPPQSRSMSVSREAERERGRERCSLE